MITFCLETWTSFRADPATPTLWLEHYAELAGDKDRMPMGVDEKFYEFLEANGMLTLMAARREGRLVGYCLVSVRPHPRYRTVLCGFEDCYFLTASERKGSTGVRLISKTLAALTARGVKKVFFMTKLSHNHSKLFERLGFSPSDLVLSKWIGAEAPLEV